MLQDESVVSIMKEHCHLIGICFIIDWIMIHWIHGSEDTQGCRIVQIIRDVG